MRKAMKMRADVTNARQVVLHFILTDTYATGLQHH